MRIRSPSLLRLNDRPGAYPDSWYAATAPVHPLRERLAGSVTADVCIVGAGYTGLSAALHLSGRGFDVAVLDAHRVGWGASGRNGGQVGSGQRLGQGALESLAGKDAARKLWLIAEEAKSTVRGLIRKHGIACDYQPGVARLGESAASAERIRKAAEMLERDYAYGEIEVLDRVAAAEMVGTDIYRGGLIDWGAGHLHPLNFALGLADAATAAGVRIFENSEVLGIGDDGAAAVRTDHGQVKATAVVLACNGYLGALDAGTTARVMPINNFMIATECLGEARAHSLISRNVAVCDDRFVVNYFRLSRDHRLIYGGGESYSYRYPRDIAGLVRRRMLRVFPGLGGVRVDYAWGGTLAITRNRMPYFARSRRNVYTASGYSGHGIAMATMAGKILAEAVAGEQERFDVMAEIPTPAFPGGSRFRFPLLALAMTWFRIRDRLA